MANWSIENMERQPDTGFVTKVNWTVTFVKDMEFSNTNGFVEFAVTDTFVPFDGLTKDQVLTWVFGKVDKDAIEAELGLLVQAKIDAQQSQVAVSGMPW